MSLSPEDWGRHLSQGLAAGRAVAVFQVPSLTLVWYNRHYRSMLATLEGSRPRLGETLDAYSPLTYATNADALRSVGANGEPLCGEDMLFSVEDGLSTFGWSIHRPCPHHVVAVIDHCTHSPALKAPEQKKSPVRHALNWALSWGKHSVRSLT